MTRIEEERIDEMLARARSSLDELRELGVNFERLVVRSHPFGALVDAASRKEFTPSLGALAYPICQALKALPLLLETKELRAQGGVRVTAAVIERIGEIVYRRHERGFVMWPLVEGERIRKELRAALSALETEAVEPVAWQASLGRTTSNRNIANSWQADGADLTPLYAHSSIPTVTGEMVERAITAGREEYFAPNADQSGALNRAISAALTAALSEESKP